MKKILSYILLLSFLCLSTASAIVIMRGGGGASPEWVTIWTASGGDDPQCSGSIDTVQYYPDGRMVVLDDHILAGTHTTLRFTFKSRSNASTYPTDLSCVSIGERTSADDTTSMTEILFSAGSGYYSNTNSEEVVSDSVTFTMTNAHDYVVHLEGNSTAVQASMWGTCAEDVSYYPNTTCLNTNGGGANNAQYMVLLLKIEAYE